MVHWCHKAKVTDLKYGVCHQNETDRDRTMLEKFSEESTRPDHKIVPQTSPPFLLSNPISVEHFSTLHKIAILPPQFAILVTSRSPGTSSRPFTRLQTLETGSNSHNAFCQSKL
ncbi:unnamed protein product [Brassica rapa subsp. narinosa]